MNLNIVHVYLKNRLDCIRLQLTLPDSQMKKLILMDTKFQLIHLFS